MTLLRFAARQSPAATLPAYTWSKSERQYRDSAGRFVSRETVRGAMDAYVDSITEDIRSATRALVDGTSDIETWHGRMEILLKHAHTAAGAIAAGGWKQARPEDWAQVGRKVKFQYQKLRQFARELENGLPLDGTIVARAEMYGISATGTYEAVLRRGDIAAGLDLERRRLHSGRPCVRCINHARPGPINGFHRAGVLPGIGEDCDCLSNCRCTFERKRSKPRGKPKPKAGPKPPEVPPLPPLPVDPRAAIARARDEQRAANEAEAEAVGGDYASLQRKFPDLIPPGKIQDRIANYKVGDAKVEAILDVGKRFDERMAVLQSERDAHNKTMLDLMDRQAALIKRYSETARPIPDKVAIEVNTLQNQIDAVSRQRDAVKASQSALHSERRNQAYSLLAVDDRAEFHADRPDDALREKKGLEPLGDLARRDADEAILWLKTHVARGEDSTATRMLGQKPGQRAYHAWDGTHIALDPHDGVPTIIHEYGHAIEASFRTGSEKVAIRSQEFLKHRVGDEVPVSLREKFGERFDEGERGRADKFGAAFGEGSSSSYYVGKVYDRDSSEILSKGMEKLYEDPVGFARADPEYAKYVMAIMDGSLR